MKSKTFTYQTRPDLNNEQSAVFSAYARYLSFIERKLFAEIASGKKPLKSLYLAKYGITA